MATSFPLRISLKYAILWTIGLVLAVHADVAAAEEYKLGPDSQRRPGVPQGKVTQYTWDKSKIFPGTTRDYWVYVPAQYDGKEPAAVMVFQDGQGFATEKGAWRGPIVLDNLINKKEMPVTIAICISPGIIPSRAEKQGARRGQKDVPRLNRSFEYDTPGDQYVNFLLEEILPEVGKSYNLTKDGNARGICGSSSGGIAAFTAAWERPDQFTRVVSFVGSFTDLRGGNDYPPMVRKMEPRALRIFMQDGENDLDIYSGKWLTSARDLDAALTFAGYEHQLVIGTEGHNSKHGSAILPDALRYVWKDYPKPPAKATFDGRKKPPLKPTVMDVLIPGEEWQLVGEGYEFSEGPAADAAGNFYFCDVANNRIHQLDSATGKVGVFAENTGSASGLMFGPDGMLYACQGKAKKVVAYDKTGKDQLIAEGIAGNDLCINHKGGIYVTEPSAQPKGLVWYIAPGTHEKKVVDSGITFPNGVRLTPDQTQLVVADTRGPSVYLFTIRPDGTLTDKSPFYACDVSHTRVGSGADGLTFDVTGRLFVASYIGLQMFDPAGRVNGILSRPQYGKNLSNVVFGGKDFDILYVTCGDKVYKRRVSTKGVLSGQEPIVPPMPSP